MQLRKLIFGVALLAIPAFGQITPPPGSGTFVTLSGDATSTATGGQTEIVGLESHALPALTTGFLNWTGTAWALSAGSGSGTVSNCVTAGALARYASSGTTVSCLATVVVDSSGNLTLSATGAASVSPLTLTGSPFTGGSGTTTTPLFYLNGGTAPTSWFTGGTYIGINTPSAYAGNMLSFHINGGSDIFTVNFLGNEYVGSGSVGTPSYSFESATSSGMSVGGGALALSYIGVGLLAAINSPPAVNIDTTLGFAAGAVPTNAAEAFLKVTGSGALSFGSTNGGTNGVLSLGSITGTAANLTGCIPSAVGDLCYWNGSAWTRVAGNTTTTNYLQETSAGVPSWTTPSGASLAFPQTVSGTTSSGGIPYFSGTTTLSSSAPLTANALVLGGGAGVAPFTSTVASDNGTTFTYTGAGGGSFSGPVSSSNPAAGVGSSLFLTQEGTIPSGLSTATEDNCYSDSTQHGILCNFNAGTTLPLVQGPASVTSGALAVFGATNGGKIISATALPNGTTATTQSAASNDTKVATDAYVDASGVHTVVDTSSPVTVSTTLAAEQHFNEDATAATAITYNLPTAAAGKQFCFSNANNGSAANTGVLTIATSASGQFIIFTDGTLSATGGNVTSGGAAMDSACVIGVDSTHWALFVKVGTWTKH